MHTSTPFRVAALATVILLGSALLVPTIQSRITWFNSGELVVAAAKLEVAHPPGYPLFTRLGHLAADLPWGTTAWRVSMLAAVFGILGAVGLAATLMHLGVGPIVAATAALTLLSSHVYWEVATNAKVYTLEIALLTCAWWTIVAGGPIDRWTRLRFAGIGVFAGLLVTHRTTAVLYLPSFVLLAAEVCRQHGIGSGPALRAVRNAGGALLAGLLVGFLPAVDLYFRLQNLSGMLLDPEMGRGFAGFWRVFTAADFRRGLGVFSAPELALRFGDLLRFLLDNLGTVWFGLALATPFFPRIGTHSHAARGFAWVAAANALFILNYNAYEATNMLLPTLTGAIALAALLAAGPTPHDPSARDPRTVGWWRAIPLLLLLAWAVRLPAAASRLDPRDGETHHWGVNLLASLPARAALVLNTDMEFRPIQCLRQIDGIGVGITQVVVDALGPDVVATLRTLSTQRPLFGSLMFPHGMAAALGPHVVLSPHGPVYRLTPNPTMPAGHAQCGASFSSPMGTVAVLVASSAMIAPDGVPAITATRGGRLPWGYRWVGSGSAPIIDGYRVLASHAEALASRGSLTDADLADIVNAGIPAPEGTGLPLCIIAALVDRHGRLIGQHNVLLSHDSHLVGEGACRADQSVPPDLTIWREPMVPAVTPPGTYTWNLALARTSSTLWQRALCRTFTESNLLNCEGRFELLRTANGLLPTRPLWRHEATWESLVRVTGAVPLAVPALVVRVVNPVLPATTPTSR